MQTVKDNIVVIVSHGPRYELNRGPGVIGLGVPIIP